jgi:hypothetical protein
MSDLDGYLPDDACPRCGEDRDVCECPQDADAPEICAHGRTLGEWCPECDVAATEQLAGMFRRLLDRIQQTEDETMGAAMVARFEKGETS